MIVILIFIIGLFIGSFLGVLTDRIPRSETVVKGRSHCEFCKKELKWLDLIPVFSFLSTRGRCRYCKHALPYFYPAIEIITGIMFVATYLFTIYNSPFINHNQIINYQLSIINLLYYLIIIASFIVIFFTDLKYGIIPDKILFSTIIISLLCQLIINYQLLIINLLCGVGTFLFFLLISIIFSALTKKDAMGGGDIKLAFLLGLILGFPNIIISLYLSFLTGALVGIILIIWKKKNFQKATLPFGPFLIFGATISLFWGNLILPQVLHLLNL
jgi:leader peptidase (prepilin peptidase) / N-methyltransferase